MKKKSVECSLVIEYVIVTNMFHLNLIIITAILSKNTKRSAIYIPFTLL